MAKTLACSGKSLPKLSPKCQYKDDLAAATWSLVGQFTATNSSASLADTAAAEAAQRFYRVERQN